MSERDKFLTEAMGECYHDELQVETCGYPPIDPPECRDCGQLMHYLPEPVNFSTWEGFGKLWEWAQEQEWWDSWQHTNQSEHGQMFDIARELVHPDRFANVVYEFLKDNS